MLSSKGESAVESHAGGTTCYEDGGSERHGDEKILLGLQNEFSLLRHDNDQKGSSVRNNHPRYRT